MDAGRFDALSRSLANRRSRRSALRGLGAGGLAAGLFGAFGVEHAPAASGPCALTIFAKTSDGPHKNTTYTGTLNLQIGENGAIDAGSFATDDGKSHPLVGQATGRALNVRITMAAGSVLELSGTADIDLLLCRGDASGVFGGPSDTDIGSWRTGAGVTSSGSANSTGGGSTSGGSSSGGGGSTGGTSTGGGSTTGNAPAGGGGAGACASGVVCNGVCCQPASGLTADTIVCNAGACECTYSCAAAGCAGGAQGSIVNTCGSDPQPHCHSECNAPADNGCGDMTCDDGTTLDVDSCTCVSSDQACPAPTVPCGAVCCPSGSICTDPADGNCNCPDGTELCIDACVPSCADGNSPDPNTCTCVETDDCGGAKFSTDPNNCGACGVVCGAVMTCFEGSCVDVCVQNGLIGCGETCINPISDPANCGACGFSCLGRTVLGLCIGGQCA